MNTPGTDYKGRACRDCNGTGYVFNPHPRDYRPGAMVRTQCSVCDPVEYREEPLPPRPTSAQLLDREMTAAWAADPKAMAREYWDRWHMGGYHD